MPESASVLTMREPRPSSTACSVWTGAVRLSDAMVRTRQVADIAGIRALGVHATDDDARAFYERFDCVQAPTDPHHLFVLLKDVRAILKLG